MKVAACGRRWGKTICGLLAVVQGHGKELEPAVFEYPGALGGADISWVAPTYNLSTNVWWELKAALRGAWLHKSEMERRITLPTHGSVSVRSADNPDSLRGIGLDGVVMDEAASCVEEAWTEALRPTLAERQGWALFIGTPKGQANWFYKLFEHAGNTAGWERFQNPTGDNPFIAAAEIDAMRGDQNMTSMVALQEIDAQFLTPDQIATWPRHWWGRYDDLPYCSRGCISVDTAGWNDKDPTSDYAVAAVWLTDGKDFYVPDVLRGRWQYPQVERAVLELHAEYRVPIVVEDVPWARPLIQRLQSQVSGVIPFQIEGRSKLARLGAVAPLGEAGNCYLPKTGAWVDEFIEEHAAFPTGAHDDQVDTTSMALLWLQRRQFRVMTGESMGDYRSRKWRQLSA